MQIQGNSTSSILDFLRRTMGDDNPSELFDFDEMMMLVDNDPDMAVMMLQNFLETERGTLDKIIAEVRDVGFLWISS